jgi:predicted acetyltransferase
MAAGYELGAISADEIDAFLAATADAFHEEQHDEETALWRGAFAPERTLVARSGGAIVGTSALLDLQISLPGAVVPVAGVSAVGVAPVHRGRGLLDRMMRGQLAAIRARGTEAISALWASEAGLYGRWGYGVATRTADVTVGSREAHLRGGSPGGPPRAGSPADLLADLGAAHAAAVPARPGMIARDAHAWQRATSDFEHEREGAGRLRALIADGPDGPGGYALFAVRKRDAGGRAADVVELRELVAATPAAEAVLWHHLLRLSLTREVRWRSAPEDPALPHMLLDARAVRMSVHDALYVRLVDLPRALERRSYAAPLDVVLEVDDAACPWNAGRWRLTADAAGATCEPTGAPGDLALGATELGAALLGGTTLALLGAAGRVDERTPGALAATSSAFKAPREPWCFEDF